MVEQSLRLNRRVATILALTAVIFGGVMVKHSSAAAATTWMGIYSPNDFPTFRGMVAFLVNLRVPIPPVISSFEIINVQISGNTKWVTGYLYRIALIGSYVIALLLAYPSISKMVFSFVISIIMLAGITIIQPPCVYDILYPFFLLLFFLSLRISVNCADSYPSWSNVASCCAGFALSMTELSRPFFFILLLIPLGYSFLALRKLARQKLILFMIPLVLFTGVWHFHQFVSFGQVLWDNHSGFNLQRAWLSWPGAPAPTLVPEPDSARLAPGRFSGLNFNTPEHGINSTLLRNAVIRYCASHPIATLRIGAEKVLNFVSGPTSMYYFVPQHSVLLYYRIAVQLATAFLVAQFITIVVGIFFFKVKLSTLFGDAGNILLVLTFCSLLFLSLGDKGEEARFLLSILPLLAAFPECWKGMNFTFQSQTLVSSIILSVGLLVGLLVLSTFFTSFMPIPFRLHKGWFFMLSLMCVIVATQKQIWKYAIRISR